MNTDPMEGSVEIAFRDFLIPAAILSEATPNLAEGTRSRDTMAGTFTSPSGTLDESTVEVMLFPPSWGWLGENIIRSRYNEPSGTQTEGNIVWNASTCSGTYDVGPVNFHYVCEPNDDNDIHLFNAKLQITVNPTFNVSDALSVTLTFHAQPDENGDVYRLGTGDLTEPSIYDVETESTVPLGS